MQRQQRIMLLRGLRSMGYVALCVLAVFGLVCLLVFLQSRRDETRQANAAIVLGAAQWNGEPSPVLRARLDHALDLYRQQVVSRIILTGGTGEGDTVSEAAAGQEYLLSQGVAPDAMLLEEQGRTTFESLTNAAELARDHGIGSFLLVSDGYHMLRSLKIAHDLGLDAVASPISTNEPAPFDELQHVVREAAAYLMYLLTRS